MIKIRGIAFLIASGFVLSACGIGTGPVQVEDAWARPGLAGGNSAVFFAIDNPGEMDTLLSVTSDVAGAVEIHQTIMQNGTMQMVQQKDVPIQTGETDFEPGGLHVMLIGLREEMNPGDTFEVTLVFENADTRTVNVSVREP